VPKSFYIEGNTLLKKSVTGRCVNANLWRINPKQHLKCLGRYYVDSLNQYTRMVLEKSTTNLHTQKTLTIHEELKSQQVTTD
jgi:hypothetical protein